MSELAGFRVAVLATDGFEESELTEPVKTLRDAGAQVTILSLEAGEIQGVRHDLDKTVRVKVDRTIRDVSTEQFDAVQLPGGTVNADTMRMVPEVQDFLRAMQGAGKPFAANAREDAGPASFTCLSAGPARSAASCSAASAPSGTATSLLLVLFLGAALGNVVRGVPLDGQGNFLEPLWTNFRLG